MIYLIARLTWIGLRPRPQPMRTGRLPTWALAALMVFLIGFRLGLNAFDATVIDVGYAGTVGADRVLRGQLPYGNFPDSSGTPCGVKHLDGTSSAYRQAKQGGALRVAGRERRHLRAGELRGLRAGGRGHRMDRALGRSARVARHLGHLRPRVRRRHGRRRLALRAPAARAPVRAWRGSPIRSPATRCRRTRTT